MRYKIRKTWRHIKYWLVNKLIPEEEKKVLFNIRMGFYGYREREGEVYDTAGCD